MIDVVFLACNRLEFTKASYAALKANTDWSRARLVVFDDGSTDGTKEWLKEQGPVFHTSLGSPVAVMNRYLGCPSRPYWAKVDNDTVVPPGWLDECVAVMDASPCLELLGIEAQREMGDKPRGYKTSAFIGGIGLFRTAAWDHRPAMDPDGRFGFTAWQDKQGLNTGWIDPALPVFLLDKLPFDPWAALSRQYVTRKWQRPWPPYAEHESNLWSWWVK